MEFFYSCCFSLLAVVLVFVVFPLCVRGFDAPGGEHE